MTREVRLIFCLNLLGLFISIVACSDNDEVPRGQTNAAYYEGPVRLTGMADQHLIPGDYLCFFVNRVTDQEVKVYASVEAEEGTVVLIPLEPVPIGNYVFARAITLNEDLIQEWGGCAEVPVGFCFELTAAGPLSRRPPHNDELGFYGAGTAEDPFIISCWVHLMRLSDKLAEMDPDLPEEVAYDKAYYRLEADIDLSEISNTYLNKGWSPIGAYQRVPFSGHFTGAGEGGKGSHTISNMRLFSTDNQVSMPLGLFGFLRGATIENIQLTGCEVRVQHADQRVIPCGLLAGAVIGNVNQEETTIIKKCQIESSCQVRGDLICGGLVGLVDQNAALLVDSCTNKANITSATHFAGGLVGAGLFSSALYVRNSVNNATIQGTGNSIGGLVGSADSILIEQSENWGPIQASTSSLGTGGLVGGSFNGTLVASRNMGTVIGGDDTGGLVGSTVKSRNVARNGQRDNVYGNLTVQCSANYATVQGRDRTGGLIGGAQSSIQQSYNFGDVRSTGTIAGGLVAYTPISFIQQCFNDGNITCSGGADSGSSAGGLVGFGQDFLVLGCGNFGEIKLDEGCAGGLFGQCGLMGFVHYSGNMASVTCGKGVAGGVAGRAGDHKDISDKLVGSALKTLGDYLYGQLGSFLIGRSKHKVFLTKLMDGIDVIGHIKTAFVAAHHFNLHLLDTDPNATITAFNEMQTKTVEKFEQDHHQITRIPNVALIPYVDSGMCQKQIDHQIQLLKTVSKRPDEYMELANLWRDKVSTRVEEIEEQHETMQKAVEGIVMCLDFASIFSIPMGKIASTVIKVTNQVLTSTAAADSYTYNCVALTQVYNYGRVTLKGKRNNVGHVAGLVGELNDYARLEDSYSYGEVVAPEFATPYMLATTVSHSPVVNRCVGATGQKMLLSYNNQGHNNYGYNSQYDSGAVDHVSYDDCTTYAGLKLMHDKQFYQGLDFSYGWTFSADNWPLLSSESRLKAYTE